MAALTNSWQATSNFFLQFTCSLDSLLHDPVHRGERIMEVGLSTKIKCQNTNPEELNQIYIINKGANRVEKM